MFFHCFQTTFAFAHQFNFYFPSQQTVPVKLNTTYPLTFIVANDRINFPLFKPQKKLDKEIH